MQPSGRNLPTPGLLVTTCGWQTRNATIDFLGNKLKQKIDHGLNKESEASKKYYDKAVK